ncbi:polymer-forming cytoskeletal protein [Dysgonomonas sp. 521]|uniref:bactofilin family protein n=1 Tax=Dysgonomonas sp. 521 TaxID=2302932 RepID=UPI0016270DCE|nr:polymer-forming cytoskeletal protein [Dysgonomonas sp. 521]
MIMGRSKENTNYTTSSGMHNVLASGTKLQGEITSEEDFRIDGTIEGNIQCRGKIIVGQSGSIKGNINCANIDLFGLVNGNIVCSETVTLKASSHLIGEIKTRIIEIEPGANFEGTCSMLNKNSPIPVATSSSEE